MDTDVVLPIVHTPIPARYRVAVFPLTAEGMLGVGAGLAGKNVWDYRLKFRQLYVPFTLQNGEMVREGVDVGNAYEDLKSYESHHGQVKQGEPMHPMKLKLLEAILAEALPTLNAWLKTTVPDQRSRRSTGHVRAYFPREIVDRMLVEPSQLGMGFSTKIYPEALGLPPFRKYPSILVQGPTFS